MAGLLRWLAEKTGRRLIPHRQPWYEGPPIPRLESHHLAGATLLPSREDLIETFPKGGSGAEIGVALVIFPRSSPKFLQSFILLMNGRLNDMRPDCEKSGSGSQTRLPLATLSSSVESRAK